MRHGGYAQPQHRHANRSNEGALEIQKTTGQDYTLTFGYEAFLGLIQEVTGVYAVADANAYAEARHL